MQAFWLNQISYSICKTNVFLATGWCFASPYETSSECDETKTQSAANQRQPQTRDKMKFEMFATMNIAGPAHYLFTFTLTTSPGGHHWRICFTSAFLLESCHHVAVAKKRHTVPSQAKRWRAAAVCLSEPHAVWFQAKDASVWFFFFFPVSFELCKVWHLTASGKSVNHCSTC